MELILKIVVGFLLLCVAISVFEKVTGINITGDAEGEMKKEEQKEPKEYSPMEIELNNLKPGVYGRAEAVAKYIVPLYKKPLAQFGVFMSTDIDTIVSKYLDNQLLFSEKYENHVIVLNGKIETIGKKDNEVYLAIGNGEYYKRSGTAGESVKKLIECYLNKPDMEDDKYKDLILKMRPGSEVTVVGVLKKAKYSNSFELEATIVLETEGVVPGRIMYIAQNEINKKYNTEK